MIKILGIEGEGWKTFEIELGEPFSSVVETLSASQVAHDVDPLFELWKFVEGNSYVSFAKDERRETARERAVAKYAFAVTSSLTIDQIAAHGPIVEVGAGSGWWAHRLQNVGCDVVATDIASPETSHRFPGQTPYTKIEVMTGAEAAARYPERTLLLVWPEMDLMSLEALCAYRGDKVIYIGDDRYGCTACDEFFDVLFRDYEKIQVIPLARWSDCYDVAWVFRRKTSGAQT